MSKNFADTPLVSLTTAEDHLRVAPPLHHTGESWSHQVDKNLKIADIILLLVSADFLASDYCYETELQVAISRHGEGAGVIPVILRPCDWHDAPFRRHIVLPRDGRPVTFWNNQDEAWTDVARGIRLVCKELVALSWHPAVSFTSRRSP
jgi:hypothetical protein